MTPNNIANMAALKGLNVVALTDHNSSKNCPAFFDAAKAAGIFPIAGMEINTSEEIHSVCLFHELEDAMAFDEYVYDNLPPVMNRPDIFGEQVICNSEDEPIGTVDKLLINATSISFSDLPRLMSEYHGIFFPSHIDRSSYSLLASFGFIPEDAGFFAYELYDVNKKDDILSAHDLLRDMIFLHSSDAHYLWDISEPEYQLHDEFKRIFIK